MIAVFIDIGKLRRRKKRCFVPFRAEAVLGDGSLWKQIQAQSLEGVARDWSCFTMMVQVCSCDIDC